MKVKEFNYTRKDGEIKDYEVMVLNESNTHLAGIDFTKLDKEEKEGVIKLQKVYEIALNPYMKAYRNFIKENINED